MSGIGKSRFRVGTNGACEALLWEFCEKDAVIDCAGQNMDSLQQIASSPPILIAANSLEEALKYLRYRSPEFNIHRVNQRGLITLISGSPVD
jgi:hypothetical protein